MPKIIFRTSNGEVVVDAAVGTNVMYAAVTNGVDGIEGECGGALACGTCRVQFRQPLDGLPSMKEDEWELLDATCDDPQGSRLGCQILITELLEGAVIDVPE